MMPVTRAMRLLAGFVTIDAEMKSRAATCHGSGGGVSSRIGATGRSAKRQSGGFQPKTRRCELGQRLRPFLLAFREERIDTPLRLQVHDARLVHPCGHLGDHLVRHSSRMTAALDHVRDAQRVPKGCRWSGAPDPDEQVPREQGGESGPATNPGQERQKSLIPEIDLGPDFRLLLAQSPRVLSPETHPGVSIIV